jgi:hypothetical protein
METAKRLAVWQSAGYRYVLTVRKTFTSGTTHEDMLPFSDDVLWATEYVATLNRVDIAKRNGYTVALTSIQSLDNGTVCAMRDPNGTA